MSLTIPPVLALQGAVLAVGAAILTITPPATGYVLLVPLDQAASTHLVPLAIASGARLVALGPLRGSMVVYGSRLDLWTPMLAAGVMVVAAPAAACGDRWERHGER